MLDTEKLELLYKSGKGIRSLNRTYYPKKARTCNDCLFEDYEFLSIHSIGCSIFKSKNGKPAGICIPVRDDSYMAEYHADNIRSWIYANLFEEEK